MTVESRFEFLSAPACLHCVVDLRHEFELPALRLLRGAVFPRGQFCAAALVWIKPRELMFFAYVIAQLSQLYQCVGRLPQLFSVDVADRVHDEMRVRVTCVAVGGDQHLIPRPRPPREFQRDLVGLNPRDVLIRRERLCVVIEENAIRFFVAILGRHEFREGVFAVAVHAADKPAPAFLIEDLFVLGAVVNDAAHDFCVLMFVRSESNCRQSFRPPYAAELREYLPVQTDHLIKIC